MYHERNFRKFRYEPCKVSERVQDISNIIHTSMHVNAWYKSYGNKKKEFRALPMAYDPRDVPSQGAHANWSPMQ